MKTANELIQISAFSEIPGRTLTCRDSVRHKNPFVDSYKKLPTMILDIYQHCHFVVYLFVYFIHSRLSNFSAIRRLLRVEVYIELLKKLRFYFLLSIGTLHKCRTHFIS